MLNRKNSWFESTSYRTLFSDFPTTRVAPRRKLLGKPCCAATEKGVARRFAS